jgi:hypothetical protein
MHLSSYIDDLRIVFVVCRQGQEATQIALFQKAKFALFLVDNFVPFPPPRTFDDDTPVVQSSSASNNTSASFVAELGHVTAAKEAPGSDLLVRRRAMRGLVMNCANAVRLQLTVQSPSAFLSIYLSQHEKWNEFLPFLTVWTTLFIFGCASLK